MVEWNFYFQTAYVREIPNTTQKMYCQQLINQNLREIDEKTYTVIQVGFEVNQLLEVFIAIF